MKIIMDTGREIDTSEIMFTSAEAENISDRLPADDSGELWQEEALLTDGTPVMCRYYFPGAVIPRDEDGSRLEDDGLLPWYDPDYIVSVEG